MFEKIKVIWTGITNWGTISGLVNESQTGVKTMDGEIKPGYLTSEFWTKNLAQLVALGATVAALTGHGVAPAQQSQIVTLGLSLIAGLEALYGVYRSALKFISDWKQGQQAAASATVTAVVPAAPAATANVTVTQ